MTPPSVGREPGTTSRGGIAATAPRQPYSGTTRKRSIGPTSDGYVATAPDLFTHLILVCPRSEPTGLDSPRWFAPILHFFFTTPPLGAGYYETIAGDAELTLFLREVFYHPKHVTP